MAKFLSSTDHEESNLLFSCFLLIEKVAKVFPRGWDNTNMHSKLNQGSIEYHNKNN